ncbi:uncharacterized protein LOC134851371 [Symsagittifera roscoffensis]|uniref:uncharacterized protein LOC134851371 n=1 Tax=Symsagittifera roscoffensis TaxID=84072 RepID=UPI00307C6FD1
MSSRTSNDFSQSSVPFCQNRNKFITFHDIHPEGRGLLHKYDDFTDAALVAIQTNRTLIDYLPKLRAAHAKKGLGQEEIEIEKNDLIPWKVGNIFDITSLQYTIKRSGHKKVACRLSSIEPKYVTSSDDVLTIEYGRVWDFEELNSIELKHVKSDLFQRIKEVETQIENHRTLNRGLKLPVFEIKPLFEVRKFHKFIELAADLIARKISRHTKDFIVIHLRGTDRSECSFDRISPKKLLEKVRKFIGKKKRSLPVYLMTDESRETPHIATLRQHFKGRFLRSTDFEIFQQEPFRSNGYMIFAVELELQRLSAGYIATLPDPHNFRPSNRLGIIVSDYYECYSDMKNNKKADRRKKAKLN